MTSRFGDVRKPGDMDRDQLLASLTFSQKQFNELVADYNRLADTHNRLILIAMAAAPVMELVGELFRTTWRSCASEGSPALGTLLRLRDAYKKACEDAAIKPEEPDHAKDT